MTATKKASSSTTKTHFCSHCKTVVSDSIRKAHRQNHNSGSLCRSWFLHCTGLSKGVTNLWIAHIGNKKPNTNTNAIEEFHNTMQHESKAWTDIDVIHIPSITNNICTIYQLITNLVIEEFKLDKIAGVEMVIGEYVYNRLSSEHPSFALHSFPNAHMFNILDHLNTTFCDIRAYKDNRECAVSARNSDTGVYSAINSIYDALSKLTDTVLINCMLVYEYDKLNKIDNQVFQQCDQSTGLSYMAKGFNLRLDTIQTYIERFKHRMLVYEMVEPSSNLNELNTDDLLISFDVAGDQQNSTDVVKDFPDFTPSVAKQTREIRPDVLEELTIYIINRMVGTFQYINIKSTFKYGNLLSYLYPRS